MSTSVDLYLAKRFRLIAKKKGTTVSQLLAQLIKDHEEAQAKEKAPAPATESTSPADCAPAQDPSDA